MTNKGRKYHECRDYFNVTKKTTNGKTVVMASCKYCGEETVLNASRLPDHLQRVIFFVVSVFQDSFLVQRRSNWAKRRFES